MSKIKLIEISSDLGGRRAGASLGMDAIRIASYGSLRSKSLYQRFANDFCERITAPNETYHLPIKYPCSKRIEVITDVYEKACKAVSNSIKSNDFTLVISGDHSSAGGTIAGLKAAFPNRRLGVVWVDAHADVHNPYTSDSGNMHGMPLSTAINDDNIDCKFNDLDEGTKEHWEALKSVGGTKDKLNMGDVVYVGLRDYEHAERYIIAKYGCKVIRTIDLRNAGAKKTAFEITKHLSNCDMIYVSFDVDSMDPSVSVGTGTPVEGGLYSYEVRELLTTLVTFDKVNCLEISEVNPLLDVENKMAKATVGIMQAVCKTLDMRFKE